MRVWKKELSCAAVKSPMKVVGAYSQVSVSPQVAWLSVAECGWVWLDVAGCGWVVCL